MVGVLGPCPRFDPLFEPNDNSLVLHLRFGARAVLLAGDAEAEQERELLSAHGSSLRADFLKVGHHGSRTSSSSPFLAQIRPRAAVASCGLRNRFGHPHEVAVERLQRAGAQLLRTDRDGAVVWQSDGVSMWWRHGRGSLRAL